MLSDVGKAVISLEVTMKQSQVNTTELALKMNKLSLKPKTNFSLQ
jgi:hypothetical protein